jgi:hypothetical protein
MPNPTEPVIDADVVDHGTEIAPYQPSHDVSLWRTTDPVEVIAQATRLADAYKDVVRQKGLIANIRGREHPQVEAWQLLGSMLGVHPVPVGEPRALPWPDQIPESLKSFHDRGLEFGFVAAYNAVKNGEVVGGGQSRCARSEKTWKDRDDFALASMAQTRAISKALSGPLRFVMTLAGYEATPAEEMPPDAPPTAAGFPPLGPVFDPELKSLVGAACTQLAGGQPELGRALFESIKRNCGGYLPQAAALAIIDCASPEREPPPPDLDAPRGGYPAQPVEPTLS